MTYELYNQQLNNALWGIASYLENPNLIRIVMWVVIAFFIFSLFVILFGAFEQDGYGSISRKFTIVAFVFLLLSINLIHVRLEHNQIRNNLISGLETHTVVLYDIEVIEYKRERSNLRTSTVIFYNENGGLVSRRIEDFFVPSVRTLNNLIIELEANEDESGRLVISTVEFVDPDWNNRGFNKYIENISIVIVKPYD